MQKKEITKLQSNYRWEKDNRKKETRRQYRRKEENETNVKRILGTYHKGKLQKEIIKGDGLIGMVNWAWPAEYRIFSDAAPLEMISHFHFSYSHSLHNNQL